jgi:outer membrane protein assembly factor BamB
MDFKGYTIHKMQMDEWCCLTLKHLVLIGQFAICNLQFAICILAFLPTLGCNLATANPNAAKASTPNPSAPQDSGAVSEQTLPVVHEPEPADIPPARPHPRVKFHGKPKPLPAGAVTHDWVSFLGPTHNAVSSETKLLKEWPKGGPKLVWELTKGTGYSSPAIAADRLVYFHRMGDEAIVECLHPETGELYWDFRYPTQFEDRFGYNNGPRTSPVIAGDRVVVYGADGKLFCLWLQTGQVIWNRDLMSEFRLTQDFFGVSCTPLIENDLLIINVGAAGGPCVAAFDMQTGAQVWGAGDKWGPSYASPVPAEIQGKRRVLVFAGGESRPPTGGLMCIDPTSGRIDFEFPWRSHLFESVNASCPVVVDDKIFISANYRIGSTLLKVRPDFTTEQLWTNDDLGTHWMTAVYEAGYFYGFDGHFPDDAAFVCIEAASGKTMWRHEPEWEEVVTIRGQERRFVGGTYRACLLRVDGGFLCLGELGHLLWMDLSPEGYKITQRAWPFQAKETWALPVLSRGLLYLSQNGRGMFNQEPARLLCYDLRAGAE